MTLDIQIGFRKGNLTVIAAAGKGWQGHGMWECKCECGSTVVLRGSHLKDERRVHCGHQCPLLRQSRLRVKIGGKYGRWTVLRDAGNDRNGNATFECRCDCGTIKPHILAFNLSSGESGSCGCWNREKITIHGNYKTIEYRRQVANKYARNNPARIRAGKLRYLYALGIATPKWLIKAHWDEMNGFYKKARKIC